MKVFVLICALAVAISAAAASGAKRVRLALPYDLAARGSTVYVADGERHQILRFNLARRRLTVFAGTGRIGTSGDGGPARRARLTEPTELVFDRGGNLYFSDVNQGRVRRITPRGVITTVARVPAAAGVAVDPTGRYLAVSSIEGAVYRVELATGDKERLAPEAQFTGPHDVTYERDGDLLIADIAAVRRVEAETGKVTTAFARQAFKVVAGPSGTFFLISGNPSGGKITQVDASGGFVRVIGTGKLSRHTARAQIDRVGFLPSDVERVGGALLISETKPVAAIRRLAANSSILTTLLR